MSGYQRYTVQIPINDPRFDELRTVLNAVKRKGKHSPVPRMLAEWALVGYLLTTGKIPTGATAISTSPDHSLPDPHDVLEQEREVDQLLDTEGWGIDTSDW